MTHLAVDRSIIRQLLIVLAGAVLILTAVDVMWTHRLAGPPETNDDDVLTSRGHAQRRQDILWSSVFLVSGAGAIAFGGAGLARRRGVLELTDVGVRARVLSTAGYLELPWNEIETIRSTTDDAGSDVDEPLFVVTVVDPLVYPQHLWGAEWRGRDLRINAGAWSTPVEEVVVHAALLAGRRSPATEVVVEESAPLADEEAEPVLAEESAPVFEEEAE